MNRFAGVGRTVSISAATVAVVALTGVASGQIASPPPRAAMTATASGLLTQPIADTAPNAAQLRRGQYLVAVGDCMSCHLREGGAPLAGGLGLRTPFGVIYSSNITPDRDTGIGAWSADQFYRAMHDGIGAKGENLYPAFPYPWFRKASREDDDAIFAYLKTVPAVRYRPPPNRLPFPLNVRFLVKEWNLLFLHAKAFEQDPNQSAEWNRGAYLVTGLAHCGGCHTPKNSLGADQSGRDFVGGKLENWVAPDLTSNGRTGLGSWSITDITEYLRTGRNARAGAGGSMADVITYSTSLMSDQDRRAIAVYLKSLPESSTPDAQQADAETMKRGAAIYSDACTACHLESGVGQPRFFPPLGRNAVVQQNDPSSVLHLILAGGRIGVSPSRPSPLSMPSFAWKLTDSETADVATYIRNSFGNQAPPVSAGQVADMRKALHLDTLRYTANSGDQD